MDKKINYQNGTFDELIKQLEIVKFAYFAIEVQTYNLKKYIDPSFDILERVENIKTIDNLDKGNRVIYKEIKIIKKVIKEKKRSLNGK